VQVSFPPDVPTSAMSSSTCNQAISDVLCIEGRQQAILPVEQTPVWLVSCQADFRRFDSVHWATLSGSPKHDLPTIQVHQDVQQLSADPMHLFCVVSQLQTAPQSPGITIGYGWKLQDRKPVPESTFCLHVASPGFFTGVGGQRGGRPHASAGVDGR
jgi:hypothetical protein